MVSPRSLFPVQPRSRDRGVNAVDLIAELISHPDIAVLVRRQAQHLVIAQPLRGSEPAPVAARLAARLAAR